MNRRSLLALVAAFTLPTLGLQGCSMLKREPPTQVISVSNLDRLLGRVWELRAVTMDGNNVVMHVDAQMTLQFDEDGQARGLGAVNQFSRGYRFDEGAVLTWTTPDYVLTRRGGPPELLDKEVIYLSALRKVRRAIAGKTSLTLQDEDAGTVLTFLAPGTL